MLFIENLALAIANRKRRAMGSLLRLRYKRYEQRLQAATASLNAILGEKVSLGPDQPQVEITEELLRAEQLKQREFFGAANPLVTEPHLEIFALVQKERQIIRSTHAAHERFNNGIANGHPHDFLVQQLHQDLLAAETENLEVITAELDGALIAAGQYRSEWEEETGARWRLASRMNQTDKDIYDLRVKEETARAKLDRARFDGRPLDQPQRTFDNAQQAANQAIADAGYERQHWEVGKVSWVRAKNLEVVARLELVYLRILKAAASRSMEFRHLKSRVTGRKESERMLKRLMSRYPKMERDIKTFNQLASALDTRFRPAHLSLADFREATAEDRGNGAGARDALFQLHLCTTELIGSDPRGPNELWAVCPEVRAGITRQLKRDRGVEELELLKKEWVRTVTYTRDLLVGLWEFVSNPADDEERSLAHEVYPLLWAELKGGNNLIAAAKKSNGIFSSGDLDMVVPAIDAFLEARYRTAVMLPGAVANGIAPGHGTGHPARPEAVNINDGRNFNGGQTLDEAMQQIWDDPLQEAGDDFGPNLDDFKDGEPDGADEPKAEEDDDSSDGEVADDVLADAMDMVNLNDRLFKDDED